MEITLSLSDKSHSGSFCKWYVFEHVSRNLQEERHITRDLPASFRELDGMPNKKLPHTEPTKFGIDNRSSDPDNDVNVLAQSLHIPLPPFNSIGFKRSIKYPRSRL